MKEPLNGPRPRYIEGRAQLTQEQSKKSKGGLQRKIRKQLVELHKLAAICHGPFKSKLLLKINNLKKLKKNYKKLSKEEIEIVMKENSI